MALILNDEEKILKQSVHDFLKIKSSINALRELRDKKDSIGFDCNLWKELADIGVTGLIVNEAYGGLDFGYVGLGQVIEEFGRALVSSPLISTVLLSTTVLNLAGNETQKKSILPRVVDGSIIIALAHEEGFHHKPNKINTEAILKDDSFILNGKKTFVLDGHIADQLIVVVKLEQKIVLVIVDSKTEGIQIERNFMMDSRNSATIVFEDVKIPIENRLELSDFSVLEKIYDIGRIGIASEMLGILQESFERTILYLKERRQFGVPIGSFQALQHRAAKMKVEIELSKSIVMKGLKAIDEDSENLSTIASLAKAKLGKALKLVTNEAIQMHGGIGMTDEFEIGFFLKRAKVAQQTLGDYSYHLDRYAHAMGF